VATGSDRNATSEVFTMWLHHRQGSGLKLAAFAWCIPVKRPSLGVCRFAAILAIGLPSLLKSLNIYTKHEKVLIFNFYVTVKQVWNRLDLSSKL